MSIDPERAAGMRASLLGQLAAEHGATVRVIEHAPEDKLGFTPHERMRSFGELAHHIYATGQWFAKMMETGKVEMPGKPAAAPKSRADLLAECARLQRDFVNRVNALSRDDLARIVEFPGEGPFAAVTFLGWHISHLIHHRGQLTVYLRLMGARVPPVYGPTLDYPMK